MRAFAQPLRGSGARETLSNRLQLKTEQIDGFTGMTVEIRAVREEDLDGCAGLYATVFTEWPYRESWAQRQAFSYLERFWHFDPAHCYLASRDGEVIGGMFGYCYPWQDRVNYYMQELFVSSKHRRQGVGHALVRQLMDNLDLRSDVSMSLIANEATPAAQFYEMLGLQQHNHYKFYCGTVHRRSERSGSTDSVG